jgi:tryptophan synthase alpha chain
MTRITQKLRSLANKDEKALACFITAGFPSLSATVPLFQGVEEGGADIVEIGMPFSDPLADGPTIQLSSQIALKNGITLERIISCVETIRKHSEMPIVLMGYLNPILAYGTDRFFGDAKQAGIDGIILPELLFEESRKYKPVFNKFGIDNILLVTPSTPSERIARIDSASEGFLYCVSTTGVTGSARLSIKSDYISKVKRSAKKNSVLVGFGIKTPGDAHRIAQYADGVIVGSALIDRISKGNSIREISRWVRQIKDAV